MHVLDAKAKRNKEAQKVCSLDLWMVWSFCLISSSCFFWSSQFGSLLALLPVSTCDQIHLLMIWTIHQWKSLCFDCIREASLICFYHDFLNEEWRRWFDTFEWVHDSSCFGGEVHATIRVFICSESCSSQTSQFDSATVQWSWWCSCWHQQSHPRMKYWLSDPFGWEKRKSLRCVTELRSQNLKRTCKDQRWSKNVRESLDCVTHCAKRIAASKWHCRSPKRCTAWWSRAPSPIGHRAKSSVWHPQNSDPNSYIEIPYTILNSIYYILHTILKSKNSSLPKNFAFL